MEDRIKLLSDTIDALERAEQQVREARATIAKIDAELAANAARRAEWGRDVAAGGSA